MHLEEPQLATASKAQSMQPLPTSAQGNLRKLDTQYNNMCASKQPQQAGRSNPLPDGRARPQSCNHWAGGLSGTPWDRPPKQAWRGAGAGCGPRSRWRSGGCAAAAPACAARRRRPPRSARARAAQTCAHRAGARPARAVSTRPRRPPHGGARRAPCAASERAPRTRLRQNMSEAPLITLDRFKRAFALLAPSMRPRLRQSTPVAGVTHERQR